MSLIQRKKNYAWISLLAMVLIAVACTKPGKPGPDPDPDPQLPVEAEKTPVGTPIGRWEAKLIGAGGGTFVAADGRVTLEFPAGALNEDTWIKVEHVTNNCPGSNGNVFRITPHDVSFNKPVKLSFSYSDTDLVASAPAAMTIAYQDEERYWRAAENMVKDTTNRKVWVTTNHFSDWALFKAFELIPYSTVVEPGKQVQLGVVKIGDFKNDSLIPLPEPLKKKKGIVKEWRLDGAGTLVKRPNDDDAAVYTAPGSIPGKNPVAVSAVLNIWSNWQFTLVSNIYIGNEGLVFRIDGGPWQFCQDHDGIAFDGYYWSTVAANITSPQEDGVTLKWAFTSPTHRFAPWGTWWPQFLYGPDPNTNYMQLQVNGKPSPGGIYFHFGSDELEYAVGTFTVDAAQRIIAVPGQIPKYSTHKIEGYFRLKWKK